MALSVAPRIEYRVFECKKCCLLTQGFSLTQMPALTRAHALCKIKLKWMSVLTSSYNMSKSSISADAAALLSEVLDALRKANRPLQRPGMPAHASTNTIGRHEAIAVFNRFHSV